MCFTACKKHGNETTGAQQHLFTGLTMTDDMGNTIANLGVNDGDWKNDNSWTTSEYALLNFTDTVSLTGTFVKDTTGWNIGPGIHEQPFNRATAFPNPGRDVIRVYFSGFGFLKYKAVLVDKNYNRLATFCARDSSHVFINLNLSDSAKYKSGVLYRLFYSFSAADSVNYYKGHGDIMICRGYSLNDCLQFVP